MSEFSKALNAKLVRVEPVRPEFLAFEVKQHWDDRMPVRDVYRISAMLWSEVEIMRSDDRSLAIDGARRAIVEKMFGEFRSHIADIRLFMYAGKTDEALVALSRMEHQMFADER